MSFALPIFNVPFTNFLLNPHASIYATYNFGAHQVIFCYENNLQTIAQISWPYQGKIFVAPLPIFLKTKKNIQGQFADPVGNILITNTFKQPLIISCEFGF